MRHDKAPHIAAIDQLGSRVLVRAGNDFNGTKVTVKVNEGKQRVTGELQDGEAHLRLPGTLSDTYSMAVTYPKGSGKPVPAAVAPTPRPQEPKQAEPAVESVDQTRVPEESK